MAREGMVSYIRKVAPESTSVFISHSSSDANVARRLADVLQGSGVGVFIDHQGIEEGSSWAEALDREVGAASAAVVLLSPSLFRSHTTSRELGALLRRSEREPGFVVLPVLLASTEPPGFLKGRQYVDGRGKNEEDLGREIAKALQEPIPNSPRFQPTDPAEYVERLRRMRDVAEREEQLITPVAKTLR